MYFIPIFNFVKTPNNEYEIPVQSGLSYSPADMAKLTSQNRSIKMEELKSLQYYDNLPDSADVPLDVQRGVDENDLWNAAGFTHDKLVDFHNKKKRLQKTNLITEHDV